MDHLFERRLLDLSRMADRRNMPVFTGFLSLEEQNIYHSLKRELDFIHCSLFGGYDTAERQMLGFLPDAFCYAPAWELFPIDVLSVDVRSKGFEDMPGHRDYLGSLLGLGLERSLIGDILMTETGAVFFCDGKITEFLCENLTKVGRSSVQCTKVDPQQTRALTPAMETVSGSVASVRIDSLIALAFHLPRAQAGALVDKGCVYINGKLVNGNGVHIRENDRISVRGHGKFIFRGVGSETRKGRIFVSIDRFV